MRIHNKPEFLSVWNVLPYFLITVNNFLSNKQTNSLEFNSFFGHATEVKKVAFISTI